jgi:CBS domain containing-hemolysin-like protein
LITALLLLTGLVVALVLSGFFSGSETGVYCLNRLRLRVASEEGQASAQRLEELMRHPERLVVTALLGTNIADYLATASMAALMLHFAVAEGWTEIYATALVTPLILVFGGFIPKDWFRRDANRLMSRLIWPLQACLWLAQLSGAVWFLTGLTRALIRWIDPERTRSPADLLPRAWTLRLLREGAVHGGLTTTQRDLIERVLNLSDVRIGQVMVPRGRAAVVPRDIGREDFLKIARMAHFSRLPVYEADASRMVGVVNVYDVLTDQEARPVSAHMRPALRLPAHINVSAALVELQRHRETLAVVQDRTGACVGLLTMKDLVEEIVGDLEAW